MFTILVTNLLFLNLLFATGNHKLSVEEKEVFRKTIGFENPAAQKSVEVDNLNGSITVIGYDGTALELAVDKTYRGRSPEKVSEARETIRLDITAENNTIRLYVDAPWRCRDGSTHQRDRYYGYDATFDFTLKVPFATNLYLRTINDGEIFVENVRGDYDVKNINGGIEMLEVAGSGRVYTLNGEVKVVFSKNPAADAYFGSLNGDVDISFRKNFFATLKFKTFNGEVFSDFPVTYLASNPPTHERKRGKNVYKFDRTFGARVGDGGPELSFDAFNGDIRVINREK